MWHIIYVLYHTAQCGGSVEFAWILIDRRGRISKNESCMQSTIWISLNCAKRLFSKRAVKSKENIQSRNSAMFILYHCRVFGSIIMVQDRQWVARTFFAAAKERGWKPRTYAGRVQIVCDTRFPGFSHVVTQPYISSYRCALGSGHGNVRTRYTRNASRHCHLLRRGDGPPVIAWRMPAVRRVIFRGIGERRAAVLDKGLDGEQWRRTLRVSENSKRGPPNTGPNFRFIRFACCKRTIPYLTIPATWHDVGTC